MDFRTYGASNLAGKIVFLSGARSGKFYVTNDVRNTKHVRVLDIVPIKFLGEDKTRTHDDFVQIVKNNEIRVEFGILTNVVVNGAPKYRMYTFD